MEKRIDYPLLSWMLHLRNQYDSEFAQPCKLDIVVTYDHGTSQVADCSSRTGARL